MFDPMWFQIPTPPSEYNTAKIGIVYSEADQGPVAMLIGERGEDGSERQDTLFLPMCWETVRALRKIAEIIELEVCRGE